ncbi:hypothetical protein ACFW1F_02040 [Streptomyces bungoensis]|uniref:hypothetical protein n=1 Tax=Streptomyces bungoensis TaxID=285568 RepID=UPI00342FF420
MTRLHPPLLEEIARGFHTSVCTAGLAAVLSRAAEGANTPAWRPAVMTISEMGDNRRSRAPSASGTGGDVAERVTDVPGRGHDSASTALPQVIMPTVMAMAMAAPGQRGGSWARWGRG